MLILCSVKKISGSVHSWIIVHCLKRVHGTIEKEQAEQACHSEWVHYGQGTTKVIWSLKSVLLCEHVKTNYNPNTHLMTHNLVNLRSLKRYDGQCSVFFIDSA